MQKSAPLPLDVLHNKKLSAEAKLLYAELLAKTANQTNLVDLGELAMELNISVQDLHQNLGELSNEKKILCYPKSIDDQSIRIIINDEDDNGKGIDSPNASHFKSDFFRSLEAIRSEFPPSLLRATREESNTRPTTES